MINVTAGLVNGWVVLALIVWVLPWKGVALWRAAKLSQKWWFIALLVLNTLGILEILYIFIFSRPAMKRQGLLKAEEKKADA
jgi:hypothetical protein